MDWGYRACALVSMATLAIVIVKPVNMQIKGFFHQPTSSSEVSSAPQSEVSSAPQGDFIVPVANYCVTSEYGMRVNPVSGIKKLHSGIDLANNIGTPVVAAADGVVAKAGANGGYGNQVTVRHSNGLRTSYAHLSEIKATSGQQVRQGEVIGLLGSTGNSTGPHLHLEIEKNNSPVNPRELIKFKELREGC